MSIIALFNLAKEYLETRRTTDSLRRLDDDLLNDIGFYRHNGVILPLAKKADDLTICAETAPSELKERPSDG